MTESSSLGRFEFVNESAVLNGGGLNGGQGSYATLVKAEGIKRSSGDAGLDMDVDDSDSDSDSLNSAQHHQQQGQGNNGGLKPGKKTKGRVKIKMEFIENKLRRYTTFSKRKTGIMKKVGCCLVHSALSLLMAHGRPQQSTQQPHGMSVMHGRKAALIVII